MEMYDEDSVKQRTTAELQLRTMWLGMMDVRCFLPRSMGPSDVLTQFVSVVG